MADEVERLPQNIQISVMTGGPNYADRPIIYPVLTDSSISWVDEVKDTTFVHYTSVDFITRPTIEPVHLTQYDNRYPLLAVKLS